MISIVNAVSKITQLYNVQNQTTTTAVSSVYVNSVPMDNPIGTIKGIITDDGVVIQFPCQIRCYSDTTGRLISRVVTNSPRFVINGLSLNDRYTCIAIDQTRRFKIVSLSNIIPK